MAIRSRALGVTLETDSDDVWRFRSRARAYYVRAEYDGDFRRVVTLPHLGEQDGGTAVAAWLRETLVTALAQDGLTLRVIESVGVVVTAAVTSSGPG